MNIKIFCGMLADEFNWIHWAGKFAEQILYNKKEAELQILAWGTVRARHFSSNAKKTQDIEITKAYLQEKNNALILVKSSLWKFSNTAEIVTFMYTSLVQGYRLYTVKSSYFVTLLDENIFFRKTFLTSPHNFFWY